MRTVIAIPPLPRMTGGIAVLYQLADRLRECGREVALAGDETAPGLAARREAGDTVLPWGGVTGKAGPSVLCADDIFVIPEGWPNMMAPALAAGCRVLVYAQNWAYVYSALPQGVTWRDLPVSFLAVSHPVAQFLADSGNLPVSAIVRPMIDTALFRPGKAEAGGKVIRIGWMPRKNKALAEQIRQIAEAAPETGARLQWVEIHNMRREEVAGALASCHIYLATGFPEGFALPPLEAMASGCLVVGFSGYGGWDYMRNAAAGGYTPRLELRAVPWAGNGPHATTGNGLFAADGDVVEAAYLLRSAIRMVRENTDAYRAVRESALKTASAYTLEAQREEVRAAWNSLSV